MNAFNVVQMPSSSLKPQDVVDPHDQQVISSATIHHASCALRNEIHVMAQHTYTALHVLKASRYQPITHVSSPRLIMMSKRWNNEQKDSK